MPSGRARVLIVEDEDSILASLEFLMRGAGHDVALARTGTEALAAATAFRPQLVILDVMLPEIDGFEVCRRLRAREAPGPRVLMLTARGRPAEVERGRAAGADAYLTKPFSTRDLTTRVAELLAESRP